MKKDIFLRTSCASLKWKQVRKQTPCSSVTSAAYCFLSHFAFWVFRRALVVCTLTSWQSVSGRHSYPMSCIEFIQKMEWISTSHSLSFAHTLKQEFGSSCKISMNREIWFIFLIASFNLLGCIRGIVFVETLKNSWPFPTPWWIHDCPRWHVMPWIAVIWTCDTGASLLDFRTQL